MSENYLSARPVGFFVIETRCLAIEAGVGFDHESIFVGYPIDLDCRIDKRSATEAALYVRIAVNGNGDPLPGYALFVESVSLFEWCEAVSATAAERWLSRKGRETAIGQLRNYMAALTACGPFGRYVLPETIKGRC